MAEYHQATMNESVKSSRMDDMWLCEAPWHTFSNVLYDYRYSRFKLGDI